jgi:hypothetical protein
LDISDEPTDGVGSSTTAQKKKPKAYKGDEGDEE